MSLSGKQHGLTHSVGVRDTVTLVREGGTHFKVCESFLDLLLNFFIHVRSSTKRVRICKHELNVGGDIK